MSFEQFDFVHHFALMQGTTVFIFSMLKRDDIVDTNEVLILIDKLEAFASGKNCTLVVAGEIEIALERLFPDDDEIQEYVTDFASYSPGGGEYLYDEVIMAKRSEYLIRLIKEKY